MLKALDAMAHEEQLCHRDYHLGVYRLGWLSDGSFDCGAPEVSSVRESEV